MKRLEDILQITPILKRQNEEEEMEEGLEINTPKSRRKTKRGESQIPRERNR